MVIDQTFAGTVPAAVSASFTAWSEYTAAVAAFNVRLDEISAREEAAQGTVDENTGSVIGDYASKLSTDDTAARTRSMLVRAATQQFAPAGARLNIPDPPFDGKASTDAADFDPESVWRFLVRNYGGQSGASKAYADMAKKLSSALRLHRDTELKMVGGRVVLSVSTYADSRFGEIISYRDREGLGEVLDGFVAVGQWSGLWGGAEELAVSLAREDLNLAGRQKILPDRRLIGDSVLIIAFKSKFEYRLSQAFAEKVNLFVSEFHFARTYES